MPTIKDVAREAGVTSATVSYVLNNSGRVSEATRQRVLAAARKLNYRPSAIAQNLRAGQSRIIGYAWHLEKPGEWTAVMQQFMYTMSLAAESAGYHVLTFIADPDDPISTYMELAYTGQVDGFVLADTIRDDSRIRQLLDLNIPFSTFGRANDEWDFGFVDVDGTSGMRQVTQHLLASGHQRIGLINWPQPSLTGENRC
ncbi:MAG: LacI family DNA-binding transcriptional regulator, partial [Chloroflexi bacterium]|nr:LacI family DNA-binding transcriptional regulator [Chloroflexota bacterium]